MTGHLARDTVDRPEGRPASTIRRDVIDFHPPYMLLAIIARPDGNLDVWGGANDGGWIAFLARWEYNARASITMH